MSDGDDVSDLTIFEGGVAGTSPRLEQTTVLVAPSAGAEFNAIVASLVPIACFRVDNIRFAFGSSFIEPGIQPELARLGRLLRRHPPTSMAATASPPLPGSPLSVFGHADPTGDDEYNKTLSGRRAQAVHALMIRDAGSWNELYSKPQGEDKWGIRAIKITLAFLDRENESAQTFDRDAQKRKALFQDYMDKLCGVALPKLQRGDFLGQGKDSKGKGDFQGCGEFNPLLVFSAQRQQAFDKQQDKTARNAANAPNRRVMVLIFRPGSKVEPSRWPCPRASEGSAGCRKRFWSDGEKRRNARLADQDRQFDISKDTFACRFYHRLSDKSPCEALVSGGFAAWEVDPFEDEPAAGIDGRDDPGLLAVDDPRASALRRGEKGI
jgi:outer membrane protein OmpA-like peptidoglycan-associated protein